MPRISPVKKKLLLDPGAWIGLTLLLIPFVIGVVFYTVTEGVLAIIATWSLTIVLYSYAEDAIPSVESVMDSD